MIFLKITDRCNMRCPHCFFACDETGGDMDISTFNKFLEFVEYLRDQNGKPQSIVVSGGEPTVNRNFREMVTALDDLAYNHRFIKKVIVYTNGKRVNDTLFLIELCKKSSALYMGLSLDQWHEKISDVVLYEFMRGRAMYSNLMIAGVHFMFNQGRALQNGLQAFDICHVPHLFIEPTGQIWECGCKVRSFGSVHYSDRAALAGYYTRRAGMGGKRICSRGKALPMQAGIEGL